MRIVGGEFGGRTLRAPRGERTRPTSDKVRQAVFNILGAPPPGARALDLYAGSGAMGLEALSRGCESAVLVEKAEPALVAMKENIAALALEARTRVVRDDAARATERLAKAGERFHWIFVDPPYAAGEMARALRAAGGVCAAESTVIAEHDVRHRPDDAVGALARRDERRWGDTCVSFYAFGGAQ